jgi:Xaa-Pro aminopeptidase
VLREAAGGPLESIGLLTAPAVTAVEWLEMVRAAAGPGVRYVQAPDLLRQARYAKSEIELACLRVSNQIATAAFAAMVAAVRPGVTELEVAAHGDFVMKSLGAEGTGLATIVLSGRRIDTIIGNASRKRIEAGEPVLMNASARYNGYCSAIGRTLVAGGAGKEQVAFLDQGVRAYELAVARLRPGAPARDVDLAARDYLTAAGLGDYHTYSVGHGTGLTECQEAEPLGRHSDYPIPRAVAIMVDVGIFGHPVHHGFRFEDSFLIVASGAVERQTDIPLRLYAA